MEAIRDENANELMFPLKYSLGGHEGTSPLVGDDRYPPAFHLAQLGVRHVDLQRELGHPDGELQLSREVQVREVHRQRVTAAHLFAVHPDLVTVWGNLKRGREEREG